MYDWADNLTSSQERVMIEPTSEDCGMNHMIQAKGERRREGIGIIGGGGGEERGGRGEERDMRERMLLPRQVANWILFHRPSHCSLHLANSGTGKDL